MWKLKPKKSKYPASTSVALPQDVRNLMDQTALAMNLRTSDVIREGLKLYFAKHPLPKDWVNK